LSSLYPKLPPCPTPSHQDNAHPPTDLLHEDVCFTVFRPTSLLVGCWTPVLACVHLSAPVSGAKKSDQPVRKLRRRARGVLEDRIVNYATLCVDSPVALPDEADVTFALEVPGCEVQPQSRTFRWFNALSVEEFHIKPSAEWGCATGRGRLRVYHGGELLAEMTLVIQVRSGAGGCDEAAP
jgi:hypothetical protein